MKLKNITALVLASMLLASCGSEPADTTTDSNHTTETAPATAAETVDPNDRSQIKDNLPDSLDFGGRTFSIYVHPEAEKYSIGSEDHVGDIVNDAVVKRNMAVEERLNIILNPDLQLDFTAKPITTMVTAGDASYDLFTGYQYELTKMVANGGLVNLYDLEYIDFDQPWWNTTFMENLQITTDNRVFLTGDFNLTTLCQLFVQYFNKRIYGDLFGNPDDLYSLVLEGKWTIDAMSEMIASAYVDLNGDGQTGPDDQLGYVAYQTYSTVDPFMYCGDVPYTAHGEDGRIVINMNQERAVTLTEKVVNLFNQTGTYKVDTSPFVAGRSLFCNGLMRGASDFRDMTDDFGFLPSPKLDEAQESYQNLVGDCVLFTVIPVTCTNAEMAAAVLEALNAQTYRTVTPAWYEVTLKLKYSRDMISSDIIDLIHDSIYTSFLFAYSPVLSQMGQVMRDLVTKNNTDYMSLVKSKEKPAQKMLEKMYKDLAESAAP
jgi:hypothetical protein